MPKTSKERLTVIETLIPAIHEKLTALDVKMDGLDHVIRGNGSPGLAAKVDVIASKVETIEVGRNRWRDAFFSVAGGIIVGLSVFLFSSQWSANHAIKTLPAMQQKP